MEAHNKSFATVQANRKADKAAGIFHFNKGTNNERNRAAYKELLWEPPH
jgi:hypothetical protein